jgi:transposase
MERLEQFYILHGILLWFGMEQTNVRISVFEHRVLLIRLGIFEKQTSILATYWSKTASKHHRGEPKASIKVREHEFAFHYLSEGASCMNDSGQTT